MGKRASKAIAIYMEELVISISKSLVFLRALCSPESRQMENAQFSFFKRSTFLQVGR